MLIIRNKTENETMRTVTRYGINEVVLTIEIYLKTQQKQFLWLKKLIPLLKV